MGAAETRGHEAKEIPQVLVASEIISWVLLGVGIVLRCRVCQLLDLGNSSAHKDFVAAGL